MPLIILWYSDCKWYEIHWSFLCITCQTNVTWNNSVVYAYLVINKGCKMGFVARKLTYKELVSCITWKGKQELKNTKCASIQLSVLLQNYMDCTAASLLTNGRIRYSLRVCHELGQTGPSHTHTHTPQWIFNVELLFGSKNLWNISNKYIKLPQKLKSMKVCIFLDFRLLPCSECCILSFG